MTNPKSSEKAEPYVGLSARIALALIRGYQLVLSPWIGGQCRFYPTCSHYASAAIREHGTLHGTWLTLRRLGKCHPFHPGGVDPVPERSVAEQSPSNL